MAKQRTPTLEQIFDRMAAAILEHNDLCPDEDHRELMRRTILDQLELGRRRADEICSSR
jgi:hypothetical protein